MSELKRVARLIKGEAPERPEIRVSNEAESIRTLTSTVTAGHVPDVYVRNGALTHLSRISGDIDAAGHNGDQAPPLPYEAESLAAAGLAALLAHHAYVYREKKDRDGNPYQEEVSPSNRVLNPNPPVNSRSRAWT